MTPAEFVALRTWSILRRVQVLGASFGEESLTDLIVLDMLPHQRARSFRLIPTTKRQEASFGADLFVAVQHRPGRWSGFALQAKKLFPNGRYKALDGSPKCVNQLKKLEQCARQLGVLPLYLLYNCTNDAQLRQYWSCPLPFVADQLGCTIVPSWHILRIIQSNPAPTFAEVHRLSPSMLWRCAFDCPFAEKRLEQLAICTPHLDTIRPSDPDDTFTSAYDWSFGPQITAWPERLLRGSKAELTFEEFDEIRREHSETDDVDSRRTPQRSAGAERVPVYPTRLLIVDQPEGSPAGLEDPQRP